MHSREAALVDLRSNLEAKDKEIESAKSAEHAAQTEVTDLKAALAATTAAVAALETEKSSLSLDEKALGERVSSLETTISSLETYNAGLEKKLKDAEANHQQATRDVGTISSTAVFVLTR